jgi:hypothetical protein
VSGISSVSGSIEMILWLLVVAHGPLQAGQFTMIASYSGHRSSTICFSSYFLPKNVHQRSLNFPCGGSIGCFSTVMIGWRLQRKRTRLGGGDLQNAGPS